MEQIPKSGLYYPYKFARIAIIALREVMGQNGLSTVEEKPDLFISTIHRCPVCWRRHTEKPACACATRSNAPARAP